MASIEIIALKLTLNNNNNNLNPYIKSILTMLCLCVLLACSIKKHIPEGERLYTGATLNISSDTLIKNRDLLEVELNKVLAPEPNISFLGLYTGLYFYYKNQKEKPGFLNKFLFKKFGEKPIYQSTVKPYNIEPIISNRLENRGFFYGEVRSQFTEKNKKAGLNYKVHIPLPYKMATYNLDTLPLPIYKSIKKEYQVTKFTKDMRFDLSDMKLERERINMNLKEKGYYNFNESFLIFEADTNRYKNKRFDLYLKLKKGTPLKSIVPYKLSKIKVYANYNIEKDTLSPIACRFNDKSYIQNELFFKPKHLDPFITLKEEQLFSSENSRNTARRLSSIGAYKFVNIQYKEIDSVLTDSLGILEASIYLAPLNKRAIRAELQGVTKSNNFAGPALTLTFSNRNLFNGGETLNLSTNVGYETQLSGGDNAGLSALELGLKSELVFPRMLFPWKINTNFFKYAIPKTKTSLGVNFLNRTKLYTLLSGNALFGYTWDANKFVTHQINPLSLNYTKLSNTTSVFDDILDDNPFLKRSFNQQFISGLTYSFTYNGMVEPNDTHQIYLNSTIDIAGNSLTLFDSANNDGTANTILGLEYAQYAKADIDFRYHYKPNKNNTIATRLFAGYGLAHGNSEVLPFVKQYFSGGPYSVRAFGIRSLGPGTFNEKDNANGAFFDQTGNIRLEANIEYRFPLFSYLNGAIFADAGNIWNSKENESLPDGKFSSNFINELGMGAGIGVRVDIQGFVIRFDLAAPFHDPAQPEGERLNFNIKAPVLNFAIGYPF